MACDECGNPSSRKHNPGCPLTENVPQGRSRRKNPVCEICGKAMVRFENPERFKCTTSRREHMLIEEAKRISDMTQQPRAGRGQSIETRGLNNRSLRDKDRARKDALKERNKKDK